MRSITIQLSADSCQDALRALEEYQKDIEKKTEEVCKRLAQYGATQAHMYFANALYDGIRDNHISAEQRENGWAIVASGKTVFFIEFGAGVYYPNNHPKAGELGIAHGTYGRGLGRNPYWFYTGQPDNAGGELAYGHTNSTITHGNPANMPMYKTEKDIREEVTRVVKEVFGAQ